MQITAVHTVCATREIESFRSRFCNAYVARHALNSIHSFVVSAYILHVLAEDTMHIGAISFSPSHNLSNGEKVKMNKCVPVQCHVHSTEDRHGETESRSILRSNVIIRMRQVMVIKSQTHVVQN